MDERIIETDVLIVGSGGAAIFAAVGATELGANVIIVDRGVFGRSGATVTTGHTCCAAIGPDDSPELHFRDTVKGGYFLSNQKLVGLYVDAG